MPFYSYRDTKTGAEIELYRPVAARDDVPSHLRRLPPQRLGYVYEQRKAPTTDDRVRKELAKLEDTVGARELERGSGYSMRELKEVWHDTPPPPGMEPVEA